MKKSNLLLAGLLIFLVSAICVQATTDMTASTVSSIVLTGEGKIIKWVTTGNSASGFKIVWSKNSGPTYPCRSGDKYNYYSDPKASSDTLTAFDGNGAYYVRVCEYLNGVCGTYSNEIVLQLTDNTSTLSQKTCKETDNGIDYFNSGKAYTTDEASSGSYYDICFNGGDVLTEWYCDGATVKSKQYTCPNGCTDGACKTTGQQVVAINLYADGQTVKWTVDGNSSQGFKVVWSKHHHH